MYRKRMNDYYPEVVKSILDIQAIIDAESPEFEELDSAFDSLKNDAYLLTMGKERVIEWEKLLGIIPIEGSSVSDRRDTIIARIRGQGKLNTTLINAIVKTFTGGTANSWVQDGVLYVEITPPPENKSFLFSNVEQELKRKVPAHLGFNVSRNYYTWGDIEDSYATWGDVEDNFGTWNDVLLFVPFQ